MNLEFARSRVPASQLPAGHASRTLRHLLASLAVTLAACGASVMPGDGSADARADGGADAGGCILSNGAVCAIGARCPAPDGCNSCVCQAGGLAACTELACLDGGPPDIVSPPDASRDVVGPRTCNSRGDCAINELCDGPPGCGMPWTCVPGRGCTADVATFCACDGTQFTGSSSCPGRPYRAFGACADASVDGGACGAMDARGAGGCAAVLGYVWNGVACGAISGCSCVGRDCGALLRTMDACTTVYASCATGPRTCPLPSGDCGVGGLCLGQNTCRVRVGLCVASRPCTRDLVAYCGCDGVTFMDSSTCPRQNFESMGPCRTPVDAGSRGCTTTADCPPSSVCEGPGCGTPDGTCASLTRACTDDIASYCGCDGRTFTASSSCANARYAHRGVCP